MEKPFTLVSATAVVVLSALAVLSAQKAQSPADAAAAAAAKAKKLYQMDCALCHGDNGDGKSDVAQSMNLTLTDFNNPATLANKTDQELFTLIRNGKDKMPSEDPNRASDSDLKALVAYVRGFSKGKTVPPAN